MTLPPEDDLPPELLAAYANGELPPDLAERVAHWLATDPEALRLADDQAALSPTDELLMDALAVPMPSAREWAACQAGIRGDLAEPRREWSLMPFAVGLAVAAGLFLAVLVGLRDPNFQPLTLVMPGDEDSDEEALVLAGNDDVEILSMPEAAAPLLLVGQLPWDEDLVLARAHELEFIGVGSDADGRFPQVPTDPYADDAPLLWTPSPP